MKRWENAAFLYISLLEAFGVRAFRTCALREIVSYSLKLMQKLLSYSNYYMHCNAHTHTRTQTNALESASVALLQTRCSRGRKRVI